MNDETETYSITLTFLDSAPWWDKITPEEWAAMSDRERLLTKMAIPHYRLFHAEDPDVHMAETPSGTILHPGDSVTFTMTIS